MAITFDVGFKLKGQSLESIIKPSLDSLSQEIDEAFQNAVAKKGTLTKPINEAISAANALDAALRNAQTDKGLSFSAMEQSLARSGLTVSQMVAKLGSAGPAFQQSFNVALNSIASANRGVTVLSSKLQEAGRVFAQSLKFTTAQNAIRFLTSSIQSSIGWVKDLDSTLAKIATVTGKTGIQLQSVYENIIQGASDLHIAANEYAEASFIFYQQGLNDDEVERRTTITVQAAKAAGQSVETMASQLTAIWNTYKMVGDEQQRSAAVGAKLAASTAVEFKDIAEAMQIAANGASQMGVSYDSLAAIIATTGDVTQQSASIIGNAYKTIFSRFEQLTTTGTDGEVTLNNVSSKLQALGIEIMGASGKLNNLEDIIYKTGLSWKTYSEEQQLAIAQLVGGTRQYGQFLALMQNFPKYLKNLDIATKETGSTLIDQFIAARDTIETAAEMSKEAWSQAFKDLFQADSMKELYKISEKVAKIVSDIISGFGGLKGILLELGFIYQNQILDKINSSWIGLKNIVQNLTPGMQLNTIRGQNEKESEDLNKSFEDRKKLATSKQEKTNLDIDQEGAQAKLKLAQQIKEEYIQINKVMAQGTEEDKRKAQSEASFLDLIQRQYNSSIDKIKGMEKGFGDANEKLEQEKQALFEIEDAVLLLNEDESARVMVLREELPILQAKNAQAQANYESEKMSAEVSLEQLSIDQQRLEAYQALDELKLKELNDNKDNLTDEQKKELELLTQRIAKVKQLVDSYKTAQVSIKETLGIAAAAAAKSQQQLKAVENELDSYQKKSQEIQKNLNESFKTTSIFNNLGKDLGKALTGEDVSKEIKSVLYKTQQSLYQGGNFTIAHLLQPSAEDYKLIETNVGDYLKQLGEKIKTYNFDNSNKLKIDFDADSLIRLAEEADRAEKALKGLGDAKSRVNAIQQQFQKGVGQNIQGFVSLAMSTQMVYNGFNSLIQSMNDGNLTFSKFLSISLQVIPALVRMASSEQMAAFATMLCGVAVDKEGNLIKSNTLYKIANTFATKVLKQETDNLAASMAVATGGITLIIGVLVALVAVLANASAKAKQMKIDTMNSMYETAQSSQELSSSINEEAEAFEEAAKKAKEYSNDQEKVAEVQEEMSSVIENMISKLKESEDANDKAKAKELEHALTLAQLTGSYDDLIEKVRELNGEMISGSIKDAQGSYNASEAVFQQDMLKKGSNVSDQGYFNEETDSWEYKNQYQSFIGTTTKYGGTNKKGQTVQDIIKQNNFSHINETGTFTADGDNIQEWIDGYKEALELQRQLKNEGFISSQFYTNLTEWLNNAADSYEKLVNSAEMLNDSQLTLLQYDSGSFVNSIFDSEANANNKVLQNMNKDDVKEALTIPEGGFDNFEQYELFKQTLLELADAGVFAADAVEQFLTANEDTSTIEAMNDKIEEQAKKTYNAGYFQVIDMGASGNDATDSGLIYQNKITEGLKKAYEGLDEDEKTFLLDFEVDPNRLSEIDKQIDEHINKKRDLQIVAQIDEQIDKVKISKDITKNLQDGDTISAEDWSKLDETYQSLFKLTEQGTYQLQASAEELNNSIETLEQQTLLDKISTTTEKANYYAKGGDNGSLVDSQLAVQFAQEAFEAQQAFLMTADSIIELDSLMQQLHQTMGDEISYNAYAEALINLGYQYDNCTQEIKNYQEALQSGSSLTIEAAEETLKISVMLGEAVNRYGGDVDVLEEQARELSEAYGYSAQQAAQIAINNQRLQTGVDKLAKSFKTWNENLKKYKKGTKEYAESVVGITDAVKDLIGATEDFKLPEGFLEGEDGAKNLKLLEEAAKGSQHAINELGISIAESQVQDMKIDSSLLNIDLDSSAIGAKIQESFGTAKEEVIKGIQTIQDNLTQLEDGADLESIFETNGIDTSNFVDALNELAMMTGMTKDEMNALLSEVGMEADVETVDVPTDIEVPSYTEKVRQTGMKTIRYNMPKFEIAKFFQGGNYAYDEVTAQIPELQKYSEPGSTTVKGTVKVAQISTDGSHDKPSVNYAGTAGGGGGRSAKPAQTGSGGGGNSSSTTKVTSHIKRERYTDNKNAITDVTTAVNRLNTATDHAWGSQKIRNINLVNKQLVKQAKLYQDLRKEAEGYIQTDKADLEMGLKKWNEKTGQNLFLEFDTDGLIDNEQALQNAYVDYINSNYIDKIRELEQILIDGGTLTTEQEDLKEKLENEMQQYQGYWEEWVSTPKDLLQAAIQEAQDALDKEVEILHTYLQNEIDKYTIKMELHLEISDLERQLHDAIIDTMGEVGKASQKVYDMIHKNLKATAGDVDEVIAHYHSMEDIQERWANRDLTIKEEFNISDEAWDKALEDGLMPSEIKDAMESDIQTLFSKREDIISELDRSWQNYIDVISHYIDEYDRITSRLDKQAEIADNLLSIIDTTGLKYKYGADETSAAYKNMNAQFDILDNKAKLVKSELQNVSKIREEAEQEMNDLLAGRSYKEFADQASEADMYRYNKIKELYNEQRSLEDDLNTQRISLMGEAYSKAADYAAEWGEVISHEFQEALGGLFDTLDEAMDMYSQKYDIDTFFMDEYDKTFELGKLQREINKVIDDVSNPEQLARYNALLQEIEEKKAEGVKITEKDLEILQAQFDLEQARDAYEDARNAKNTMRLTRDASGNYTYVYSGDEKSQEDKAADIEEKLHNIYKLHRDAADEYSESWLQLQVDWQNYIDSIDQARLKMDDNYRREVEQRMQWYAEQSDQLSGEIIKHNDAIERKFEDTTLGIITNLDDMATANEIYKNNHSELKDRLVANYQEWIDKADETRYEVGGAMEELEDTVDRETDLMMEEVNELGDEIERFTIEAENDLDKYAGFVGEWSQEVNDYFQSVIDQIYKTIKAYQDLLAAMEQQAKNEEEMYADTYDKGTDYSGWLASEYDSYKKEGGQLDAEAWLRKYHEQDIKERNTAGKDRGVEVGGDNIDATYRLTAERISALVAGGWDYNKSHDYGGLTSNKVTKTDWTEEVNAEAEEMNVKADTVKVGYRDSDGIWHNGETASGGLVKTPQVRSLAEEGPELVLNAEDTQKILEAVKNVRNLTYQQLQTNWQSYIAQVSSLASEVQSLDIQTGQDQSGQSIDQNVHIEAVFPGIDTAAEVEAALNSLIVQAAHYSITNK